MIGIELVSDPETRQPLSTPHFMEIWEQSKDMGVLFGRGGINGNVSNMFFLFFFIVLNFILLFSPFPINLYLLNINI